MQYRRLGRSELMVAEVGIGTSRLAEGDLDVALEVLIAGIEAGANVVEVDTRDERALEVVARALPRRRGQVVLVGLGNGDRESVMGALGRLGAERFDCYLLSEDGVDGGMMGDLDMAPVQALGLAGLAGSVGLATELAPAALAAILQGSVDVVQVPMSVLELVQPRGVDAVLNAAQAADVGVLACAPLEGGRLGEHGDASIREALAFLEQGEPRSMAQGAIAWALTEPRVAAVVSGPRTLAHVFENLEASRVAPLPSDVLERVALAMNGLRA